MALLPGAPAASAQTSLNGSVHDASNGSLIVGARVEVHSGGATIGDAVTDGQGRYEVRFDAPSTTGVGSLTLHVESGDYIPATPNFQISNGHPVDPVFNVTLLPVVLGRCRSLSERSVIIGHFRSPLGQTFEELPERIAVALTKNLKVLIQLASIPSQSQPTFEPCDEARPRVPQLGRTLAKALGADALLSGDIAVDQPLYKVSTTVNDAYSLFASPWQGVSRSVDLDIPDEAKMSDETRAAVAASIVAGFSQRDDCPNALALIEAIASNLPADAIAGDTQKALSDIQVSCKAKVRNAGLLR